LIDDSDSISLHWDDVVKTLEYIAKETDNDGPCELHFTCSGFSMKGQNRAKELVSIVKAHKRKEGAASDINLRLTSLLEGYSRKLEEKGPFGKGSVKPMNLYIFTDGVCRPWHVIKLPNTENERHEEISPYRLLPTISNLPPLLRLPNIYTEMEGTAEGVWRFHSEENTVPKDALRGYIRGLCRGDSVWGLEEFGYCAFVHPFTSGEKGLDVIADYLGSPRLTSGGLGFSSSRYLSADGTPFLVVHPNWRGRPQPQGPLVTHKLLLEMLSKVFKNTTLQRDQGLAGTYKGVFLPLVVFGFFINRTLY
jgi:hypothetical protein